MLLNTESVCMPVYVWDGLSVCRCRGEKAAVCVSGFCAPKQTATFVLTPFWTQEEEERRQEQRGFIRQHPASHRHGEHRTPDTLCSAKVEFCKILYSLNSRQLFYFLLLFGSSCVLKSVQWKIIIWLLVPNTKQLSHCYNVVNCQVARFVFIGSSLLVSCFFPFPLIHIMFVSVFALIINRNLCCNKVCTCCLFIIDLLV